MFDAEPMPPGMISALWPMANELGWERKWAIVGLVGSFLEGTWLDGADVATSVGCNIGRARMHLLQLTEARVLERDGGGGGRKFWYRVNPDWKRWRVQWRYDRREVEQRLAWWEKRASRHPLDEISARRNGARYSKISARLMARANEEWARANDPIAAIPMGRYQDPPRAAHQVGGAEKANSAPHRTRANSPGSAPHWDARYSGGDLSSRDLTGESDGEPSTTERPRPKDGPGWTEAKKAVLARCVDVRGRGLFLNGPPARLLRVLLDHHGLDEVLAAIAVVPDGLYGPPVFVEAVEDVLDAGVEAGADPGPGRLSIEAKLLRVRQQIANYESLDVPVPEQLLAERDALTAQADT